VIGLAELGGEGLVAAVADRIGKPRAVGVGLALNSLAGLLLPVLGQSPSGALVGLFLFYLTFEFSLVSTIPLMTELAPQARSTMMSGNIAGLSAGRVAGAGLGLALFPLGLAANTLAVFVLNALAFLVLVRRVREVVGGA
jgi:predicted MFS family arabinose efflux permease